MGSLSCRIFCTARAGFGIARTGWTRLDARTMTSAPSKGPSRAASFLARLTSTILLWGIVGMVFWSGKLWAMAILVAVLGILGCVEYFALTREAPGRECRVWGLVVSVGFLFALMGQVLKGTLPVAGFLPEVVGISAVVLGAFTLRLRFPIDGDQSVRAVMLALLGFVYVPILFAGFIIRTALLPGEEASQAAGFWLILLVVLVAKFTDMGAYLVGTLCGKHKAIPHISPAKSWEGYLGSLFVAQGGAFGIYALGKEHFEWIGGAHHIAILGVLLALAAMVGDLAESILKRSLRAKDSGHLLPGIGGILDLIDSLCFALPVAFLYVYLVIL
jgi:phosphatidate cytidylyltransferase